jgi:hypothetical protein
MKMFWVWARQTERGTTTEQLGDTNYPRRYDAAAVAATSPDLYQ